MELNFIDIQNFRKLKACRIDIGNEQTIFVGPNNSGKTSAMDSLSFFLTDKNKFSTRDFTLNNWLEINKLAEIWLADDNKNDEYWDKQLEELACFLPQIDLWLNVSDKELHYVHHLIPTLDWKSGLLGIRLRYEPINLESLLIEFKSDYDAATKLGEKSKLKLWPKDMWDFLDHKSKLPKLFTIKSYILDPAKVGDFKDQNQLAQELMPGSIPIDNDSFKGLIKVSTINAQRGFSDVNNSNHKLKPLSTQFRDYYSKHLSPEDKPTDDDLGALTAIDNAKKAFDDKLKDRFGPSLNELGDLNYPGFGNPNITISSSISPIDGISHDSAIQFEIMKDKEGKKTLLSLPEQTNGLGYQNLISMVFELIRFRDEWMKVGKRSKSDDENEIYEPLHLVLIEEPEAHLHAQVQQVFINKAYDILRAHKNLGKNKKFTTQLIVSTHSNHIAHEVDFVCLRYFKRLLATGQNVATSKVINLSKTFGDENATTRFATRYLKTTHCDLFFADAVILIEGAAERMLIPHFINNHHKNLSKSYLSLVEIAGSHAHKLQSLIEDLGVLTLIVTDLDPIDPTNNRTSVIPKKNKGYETANSTISKWVPGVKSLDSLIDLDSKAKVTTSGLIRVAYQINQKITVDNDKKETTVNATSFEDSLVYENIVQFKSMEGLRLIRKFKNTIVESTVENFEKDVYETLRKSASGDKAAFALDLLFLDDLNKLKVPKYIEEGLIWLEESLSKSQNL
ncbi:AAA family ATPase [Muricauda sp. HICW]|uniref:AAA family ATPase n=1 Tax=Flagellimonas chongwuensis TaxID=2697365 RepID=A0A850NC13_9FLAO|nr:ATP-dependent endonuclease [Allomuricauda chongwuensis]NVN18243.1 AAA family ATPase [Allomuricauda chongwuensis]